MSMLFIFHDDVNCNRTAAITDNFVDLFWITVAPDNPSLRELRSESFVATSENTTDKLLHAIVRAASFLDARLDPLCELFESICFTLSHFTSTKLLEFSWGAGAKPWEKHPPQLGVVLPCSRCDE